MTLRCMQIYFPILKGATSIEKTLKFQLLAKIFWTPSPLFEKGPYRRKRRYFVPNSNSKVRFFWNFNPPYFTKNPNLTDFYNWGGPLLNLQNVNILIKKNWPPLKKPCINKECSFKKKQLFLKSELEHSRMIWNILTRKKLS